MELTRRSFLKNTGLGIVFASTGLVDYISAVEEQNDIHVYCVPVKVYTGFLRGTDIAISQQTVFYEEGKSAKGVRDDLIASPGFVDNYNQLPIRERKKVWPFRFTGEDITQEPDCVRRNNNDRGDYICGKLCKTTQSGDNGMCTIGGYDVPIGIGCPYEKS